MQFQQGESLCNSLTSFRFISAQLLLLRTSSATSGCYSLEHHSKAVSLSISFILSLSLSPFFCLSAIFFHLFYLSNSYYLSLTVSLSLSLFSVSLSLFLSLFSLSVCVSVPLCVFLSLTYFSLSFPHSWVVCSLIRSCVLWLRISPRSPRGRFVINLLVSLRLQPSWTWRGFVSVSYLCHIISGVVKSVAQLKMSSSKFLFTSSGFRCLRSWIIGARTRGLWRGVWLLLRFDRSWLSEWTFAVRTSKDSAFNMLLNLTGSFFIIYAMEQKGYSQSRDFCFCFFLICILAFFLYCIKERNAIKKVLYQNVHLFHFTLL